MSRDKYAATWVSHSSISDFIHCPRSYYLRNVYRSPKTNHKIKLMSPPLALGQAVHETLDYISALPLEKRFSEPWIEIYEKSWEKVKGKLGGFRNEDTENKSRNRGREMIMNIFKNPGPIAKKAVKIKKDLPYYWISEEDNIILCGKVDWLEYLPDTDSVHIIDFKTSKFDEDPKSLQLPIYYLLVKNTQHRVVTKMSYWYIERNPVPTEKELPVESLAEEKIMEIAREIKAHRQLDRFICPSGGCEFCLPYEKILLGESELVGRDSYGAEIYINVEAETVIEDESEII